MRFGVIILTRDRPDLLRECLRHLQTSVNGGPKPPVFVWDNGADEETPAICAEFGARRLGGDGTNISFSAANNAAARGFKGDLLLLNNDVFVRPGCLEALIAERKAGCDIVGTKLLYPNGTIQHYGIGFSRDYQPFHVSRGAAPHDWFIRENRVCPAVTFACVMISRKTWDDLGGLDEEYFYSYEDIDFCLRARETGAIVGVSAAAQAVHLESQTEGRSANDGVNWVTFHRKWVANGRLYAALGVWPFWISDSLGRIQGPIIQEVTH